MSRSENISCASCGDGIDPRLDTHYRVDEEERPIKQLEKAEAELEFDDFFSRGWYVCTDCMGRVLDLDSSNGGK